MGQEWRNYGQETRPDGKWVRATGKVGVQGLKDRLENFEAFADAAEAASWIGLRFGVDIERARPRPASAYGLKVLGLAQCKGLFGGVKARGWELGYIRQDLAEDVFEHLVANDISIASELCSILYDMTDPAVLFYLIVPKGDTREDRSRRKQAVEAMTEAYEIRSGYRDPSPSRHRSLQYVRCTFTPGGRAYIYHWDGEPVKVGDQVEAVTRDGKVTLAVVGVSEDSPSFATKPILGLAPPKEDAPEPAATDRRVEQKTRQLSSDLVSKVDELIRLFADSPVMEDDERERLRRRASGAPDFLNQDVKSFRAIMKVVDQDLVWQCETVTAAFERYLKTGEIPAPHYPMRIVVLLHKAKDFDRERQFLAAWCNHFPSGNGATYAALVERAKKTGAIPA